MTQQLKIALVGKMRSGKDTVGEQLINLYGFRRYAFGDGIKEIVETYFPLAWVDGKPRRHFQHIGQSLRELDEDVWVNYCLDKVSDNTYDNIVITDARQENEVKALREAGFIIVKVICDEAIRIERMRANNDNFNLEDLQHETELYVDDVVADIELRNEGTLEELKERVFSLVKYVRTLKKAEDYRAVIEGE